MSEAVSVNTIGWLGEFRDRQQESRFRAENLDNARKLVLVVSLSSLAATVLLAANDLVYKPNTLGMLTPREIQAVMTLGCCVLAWRATEWRTVYLSSWLLGISIIVTTTMIELSRPPDYLLHLGMDVLILMGVYIAIPSVSAQILINTGYTAILLWMHYTVKEPAYEMAELTVPMTIFLANFIGLLMSALYNRAKRQFYARVEIERQIRQSLEAANQEVDQLSRLVPMCSLCKNVRDDEGFWQGVEKYMESLSGQRVSHGICPGCAKTLYGEEFAPPASSAD